MRPVLISRHTRYLARVFLPTAQLAPTSSNFRRVSELLADEALIPAQAAESVGGPPRIGFRDPSGFDFVVGVDSLLVSHAPTPGNLEAFLERASELLQRVLTEFPPATRLALIQEGVMERVDDEVATRLFHLPKTFSNRVPFEWDWRCATKIEREVGTRTESTNTLATLLRRNGQFHDGAPFDGIVVVLDINTNPENGSPRFGVPEVTAFLRSTLGWHADLASELDVFVSGR